MRIPLVGSSYQGVSVALDSQRTKNMMVERADSKDAAAPSALVATPGLDFLRDATGTAIQASGGVVRGLFNTSNDDVSSLLIVAGSSLYQLSVDVSELLFNEHQVLSIATISSGGVAVPTLPFPTLFAENATHVVLTNQSAFGYRFTKSTPALSTRLLFDADPTTPLLIEDIAYLAGYFIAVMTGGSGFFQKVFYSTDGVTWSSSDFFSIESSPNTATRLKVRGGLLYIFTQAEIIPYSPTGNANDPFAPIVGAEIPWGTDSKQTVASLGENIYFLGNDVTLGGFAVARLTKSGVQRVSNRFVENRIQDLFNVYGKAAVFHVNAYGCMEGGHPVYKMHFHRGGVTLVYDELTNEWHERYWTNPTTGADEEEIGWVYASFLQMHIVGDRRAAINTGGLYQLSNLFKSNTVWPVDAVAHTAGVDTIIRRERISPQFSAPDGELLTCGGLELLFETGKAEATGQGSDPKVTLYISRDGGNTYGNGITRTIGKVGKYKDRCTFNGLGSAYKFVFKIVMTDPIAWKLISAIADLKVAA